MHRFEYQGNTDYNYIVAIFCCYLISYLTIQLVNFYLYYTRNLFLEKIAYETYLMRRLLFIKNNVYDNRDDGSDISDGEDSNESDDCENTSNSTENEHNVDRQSVDTENSSEQSEQCEEDKNRFLNDQTEDLLKKKVE